MPRSLAGLLVLAVVGSNSLSGQGAATLLAAAQEHFAARRLDSAAALLNRVVDSSSGATSAERLNAWVKLGIVRFYAGDSAGAAMSFRNALAIDSGLQVAGLERIDPTLGAMLAEQRSPRAASTDSVWLAAIVDQPPQLAYAPPLQYPADMRQRGRQGTVTLEAVIDTAGLPEPGSVRVVESPDSGFDASATALLRGSRFSAGRADGRAVRVLVRVPIDFELGAADSTPVVLGPTDSVHVSGLRRGQVRPPRLLGGLGRLVFQPRPGDRAADFGYVVLQAVVDTFGLIVPGTAAIESTTMPDWVADEVLRQFRNARFEPGLLEGRKVRVSVRQSVRVRFGSRGRTR